MSIVVGLLALFSLVASEPVGAAAPSAAEHPSTVTGQTESVDDEPAPTMSETERVGDGAALAATAASQADPDDAEPAPTVSDFYPESNDLSDCVGLVEQPGCGSGSRGGWRQTAIFGALAVGLGFIVWRITVGLRANRQAVSSPPDDAVR